jgi:hypothetical protein
MYINATELPEIDMPLRPWEELVAEFGIRGGDVIGVDENGGEMLLDRDDYNNWSGAPLHFQAGCLEADDATFFRWECEDPNYSDGLLDDEDFQPSDDDPMSLFG